MQLKVTFLGTGTSQGIPLIGCQCEVCQSKDPMDRRLRTSVMIETGDKRFVIDTGPDFRQQMLREDVRSLDAVIFTHEHKDHIAGLDEIRAFNFLQKKAMPVYATKRVQQAIRREYAYIFETPQYPGIPKVDLFPIGKDPFMVEGIEFTPVEVMHHQLSVLGFRVGNFSYITDANFISKEEKKKIKGSEILVLNALRRESHISHYTLEQAVEVATELGAKRTYFTHLSHQMGLHKEVVKELPENIFLAYDGLQLELK
ncbi:MAG TPA: MBL fold metallo-hydrolase [Bacteroidia bacterium]|jgi:phosphoribosyl 1,2-cyclic phosphate phosphodiesterase|nr:MBL fold metallo-hydrolase [Bacteroidia bacterium]